MSKTRKLSNHIPFDIQSEFIKRLPVKSVLQFRSVSKQWKSFIDDPKFIKNYQVNHTNPQHHLLVSYELDTVQNYTSIIDNNTFPKQKLPLTPPESLHLFRGVFLLNSVDGLLCFCDRYGSHIDSNTEMVVIWNPTVRKSVSIVIPVPKVPHIIGFGVSPDTSDPKLVKITDDKISWVVEVFTLCTRVWKTVYTGTPFKLCEMTWIQAFVNGVIYFHAIDYDFVNQVMSNFIISYDLKSEKFGEVCLTKRLVHTLNLNVMNVNVSLGLLEYYDEGGMKVCGVWSRKDGANNPFTKICTVKLGGDWFYNKVLGFRNNGEVVVKVDDGRESGIGVYDPSSGHINGVGINGNRHGYFCARSYMETLLLLDESDPIIHEHDV